MPILSKSFRERDPILIAVVGVLITVLLALLAYNGDRILRMFTYNSYTAEVTEVGNLKEGAEVRLAGVDVGKVEKIRIRDDVVAIDFTMRDDGHLGDATRAAIKSETVLGAKYLDISPAGNGQLEDGATIPVQRTDEPYDVTNALDTLTRTSEKLDKGQLAQAVDSVSEALAGTPENLRSALVGMNRLSQAIASRDTAIRDLLDRANGVTRLLAERNGQLVTLLADGSQLLNELNQRRAVLRSLLGNVTATIEQLKGLVKDNERELGPAMDELKGVVDMLNRQDKSVAALIHGLNMYAGSLGEAVGVGPWFYALVPNLVPSNLAPMLPTLLGEGK